MTYKITIKYAGVVADPELLVSPICRIFVPTNSYIDTPVYTEGVAGTGGYGPSVYATNVSGYGSIPQVEPYASTSFPFPIPLAQFKIAVISDNNEVEFETEDFKEVAYYKAAGEALADQGFSVEVEEI